jgi:crossover junction endodeoxyribonuclease RusA
MSKVIEFFVPGVPKPAGSKRAFKTKTGKVVMVDASGKAGEDWRGDLKKFALEHCPEPLEGPVDLMVIFVMPRPKSHLGSGRNASKVKPSAPDRHTTRPDVTKLLRAVEDALTGICWKDDAQICLQRAAKIYANQHTPVGAYIYVVPASAKMGESEFHLAETISILT